MVWEFSPMKTFQRALFGEVNAKFRVASIFLAKEVQIYQRSFILKKKFIRSWKTSANSNLLTFSIECCIMRMPKF
jgi:hypothetical protein